MLVQVVLSFLASFHETRETAHPGSLPGRAQTCSHRPGRRQGSVQPCPGFLGDDPSGHLFLRELQNVLKCTRNLDSAQGSKVEAEQVGATSPPRTNLELQLSDRTTTLSNQLKTS